MKNKNPNINCRGCVSKLKSDLDNAKGSSHWNVEYGK